LRQGHVEHEPTGYLFSDVAEQEQYAVQPPAVVVSADETALDVEFQVGIAAADGGPFGQVAGIVMLPEPVENFRYELLFAVADGDQTGNA